MNIDRVAQRAVEVGVRKAEAPRRSFDLTVSDQGVEKSRQDATGVGQTPLVASTPEMQGVLSAAETRALHETFFTPATQEPARVVQPLGGGYNLRGQSAVQQIQSGAMLDITG